MSGVTGHLHSPDYMSDWVSECVYSYSARTPKVLNTIVSHEQVSTFDLTPEKSTNVTRTLFFGWNCGTATVWIIWITLFSCRSYKNPRTNNSTIRTHTHTFNGPFSGTTQVSRYQKGKTNQGRMPFLPPNQQRQSTEGSNSTIWTWNKRSTACIQCYKVQEFAILLPWLNDSFTIQMTAERSNMVLHNFWTAEKYFYAQVKHACYHYQ